MIGQKHIFKPCTLGSYPFLVVILVGMLSIDTHAKSNISNIDECDRVIMNGRNSPMERGKVGRPDRSEKGAHDSHSRGRDRYKAFKEADLDKDGALSFEEFSKMGRITKLDEAKRRKLFDFLDRDNDGEVHIRELQPREPEWIKSAKKQFGQLDADKNGTLDLNEYSKLACFKGKAEGVAKKFFAKLDRNKNNKLERGEIKMMGMGRPRPHFDFKKYDTNKSGGLDIQEYSKIPWMDKWPEDRRQKLFQKIDIDHNGEVSIEEVRKAHQLHRPSPHRKSGKSHRGERHREHDKGAPSKHRRKGLGKDPIPHSKRDTPTIPTNA